MSYRPLPVDDSNPVSVNNIETQNGSFRPLRDPLAPFIDWAMKILPNKSQLVGYLAGGLFSIGWWIFLDGITISSTLEGLDACRGSSIKDCYIVPNLKVCNNDACLVESPKFEDWVPSIFSTFSLIM